MSRYSPQVLPQRGITLSEVAMAGVEAFRSQRDRGRKQEFEDKAEERAAGRFTLDQNQDQRAERGDARDQTRLGIQQEEANYNRTTVRPIEQAGRVVNFMNAGGMAPGTVAGGVEVAPGLRIDPDNIAGARQRRLDTAKAAFDEQERKDRLTIAREGNATRLEEERIRNQRPTLRGGGSQYNFGGGGTAQPGAAQRFEANERNAKMLDRQITAQQRQLDSQLKYGDGAEADTAGANRLMRMQQQQDRILMQNDSIAGGIPLPSLAGGPAAGPPRMRSFSPAERAKGASDLDYANRVTQWREAQVSELMQGMQRERAEGRLTAKRRAMYEAEIGAARSAPPPPR